MLSVSAGHMTIRICANFSNAAREAEKVYSNSIIPGTYNSEYWGFHSGKSMI